MTGPVHRKPHDQEEITGAAPPTEAIRISTASRTAIVSVPVPVTFPDTPGPITIVLVPALPFFMMANVAVFPAPAAPT